MVWLPLLKRQHSRQFLVSPNIDLNFTGDLWKRNTLSTKLLKLQENSLLDQEIYLITFLVVLYPIKYHNLIYLDTYIYKLIGLYSNLF